MHFRGRCDDQIGAFDHHRPDRLGKTRQHQRDFGIEREQSVLEIGNKAIAQRSQLTSARVLLLARELEDAASISVSVIVLKNSSESCSRIH